MGTFLGRPQRELRGTMSSSRGGWHGEVCVILVPFQVYACMMVFFLSNMIENQCMSTGAFEITLNGKLRLCLRGVTYSFMC